LKTGNNYKTKDKSFYKDQFKKIIISILIVLVILLIKTINVSFTNKVVNIVNKTINYTTDVKEDSKKLLYYVKEIPKVPDKIISAFNGEKENSIDYTQEEISEEGYINPVTGVLYQKFGKVQKSKTVSVFYKGIDILVSRENVVAIGKGTVTEIGKNSTLGKFIKIDHGELQAVYGHLDDVFVDENQEVIMGEDIGNISNIENDDKYLHLEIWIDNSPVDPLEIIQINPTNSVAR